MTDLMFIDTRPGVHRGGTSADLEEETILRLILGRSKMSQFLQDSDMSSL